MLTKAGCTARQQRLRERLAAQNVEAAVIADPRDVYYLTGVLPSHYPTFLYLPGAGGRAAHSRPASSSAAWLAVRGAVTTSW